LEKFIVGFGRGFVFGIRWI